MEKVDYKRLLFGVGIIVIGFISIGVGILLLDSLTGGVTLGSAATVAAAKKALLG